MNKSDKKVFYITTTLPYVNSKPHIGFAMEIIRADAIARYKKLIGYDVYFNTGTDEHGIKIFQKAKEENKDIKEFVDENANAFKNLKTKLNLSYDTDGIEGRFIRTTDEDHKLAAQSFWKKCAENGFIYKKNYEGMYCSGCEMFVQEKDLLNGECSIHTGRKLEKIAEENYFFKFSAFTEDLKKLFKEKPNFVIPKSRFNEMEKILENGLEDFSISRLKEKLPWGVAVPDDDQQVIYVWFDALVNYISTLGWPEDLDKKFLKYWVDGETVQICGKDNTQHQALRWQAMLKSVGLPYSDKIIINGFINGSDGRKMSKSLGNVIDPVEIVDKYGTDALRYYVLRELSSHEDSDFSMEKFHEAYTANLVNGLGNLTNRILKLSEDYLTSDITNSKPDDIWDKQFKNSFSNFDYKEAIDIIWKWIKLVDEKINREKPFSVVKEQKEKGIEMIKSLLDDLKKIAFHLQPFLPETSERIFSAITKNKKPENPLFPRLD